MLTIERESLRYMGMIYDAALDRAEWPGLLNALMHSIGGSSAVLRRINPQTRSVSFYESVGYDPAFAKAYREHFCHLDPYQAFFRTTDVGCLLDTEEKFNVRQRRHSEYFNDFELPQDKVYAMGGVLNRESGSEIQFGIQRGQRAGNFSKNDRQLLRVLLPHMTRAFTLHEMLASAGYQRKLAYAALDQLRLGVFLLGSDGKLLHCNRAADDLLETRMISVRQGRLLLCDDRDTTKLRGLIDVASKGLCGNMLCQPANPAQRMSVWVACLGYDRSPQAVPSPTGTSSHRNAAANEHWTETGNVAVFVSRTGPLDIPLHLLMKHYGLSRAEARIAAALADGKPLEEIAIDNNVAYETARSQLKTIFLKTGTRRQPELVSVILKALLTSCRDES